MILTGNYMINNLLLLLLLNLFFIYFNPNRTVRLKAGVALSYLIDIHMRPDPLFNELANGIKNADEAAVRDTYLQVSNIYLCGFFILINYAVKRS